MKFGYWIFIVVIILIIIILATYTSMPNTEKFTIFKKIFEPWGATTHGHKTSSTSSNPTGSRSVSSYPSLPNGPAGGTIAAPGSSTISAPVTSSVPAPAEPNPVSSPASYSASGHKGASAGTSTGISGPNTTISSGISGPNQSGISGGISGPSQLGISGGISGPSQSGISGGISGSSQPAVPSESTGISIPEESTGVTTPQENCAQAPANEPETIAATTCSGSTTTGIPESPFDSSVWLSAHNSTRAAVGVCPVKWNNTIAQGAQAWANCCPPTSNPHSDISAAFRQYGSNTLGENVTMGEPYTSWTDSGLYQLWANEESSYTAGQTFAQNPNAGHYTQIVNKTVTDIGCGCANCSNWKFCVCRYNPIQQDNQVPY